LVMFPNYEQAEPLDVLTLMSDPYASTSARSTRETARRINWSR